MDQSVLQLRLHRVLDLLHQLEVQISSLDTLDKARFPAKYEAVCGVAALQSEKITCILRRTLYESTVIPKIEYLAKAASAQGIKISLENKILSVRLPCPLPKKRGKYSSQFVLDPLNAAFEQFNKTSPMTKYRDCTVCCVHMFRSDCGSRKYFDYDNLQFKQILDVIALHAMVDDNSMLCDVLHTSEPGYSDETMIYVMPKNRFPEWLSKRCAGQ